MIKRAPHQRFIADTVYNCPLVEEGLLKIIEFSMKKSQEIFNLD